MTTKLLAASSAIQTAPSIHLQSAGLARSLSLLLLTLGMTPSALSQVYSVNAVGYVNVTLPGNPRQALIANPLNGTNNHLNTILPLPDNAEGTRILRWNVPSQSFGDPIEFIGGIGWNSSNPDPAWVVLPPGEGFYIQSAVASPSLVTFVGDVPQGILTQVVPAGISYLASMVPVTRPLGQAGAPGTHQFPAAEGDSVWLWDTASQTFTSYEFMEGLGWFPDDPVIGPAQGFVSMKTAPAFWPQHFVVNLAGSRLGSPAASLAIAWLGSGNVRITWPASEWKLQQATDVQGTWSFVPGNPASPYITPAIGARKFFRLIQTQTCVAISCPANTNLTGSGPTGTPVVFTATATNICTHTVVPVTCTPASGSPFPLGSTTVACLATNSGETATCTFTVTVLDSVPPQITCPSDVVVSAAPGQCEASVSFTVTATDNLDPAPTITCAPPSGSTFPVGRTTVLCTAWDASGNISTCSFIVSVYPTQLSPAGEIWTARESNRNWRPVASSADGTRLVGIVQGVPIFTSAATPRAAHESTHHSGRHQPRGRCHQSGWGSHHVQRHGYEHMPASRAGHLHPSLRQHLPAGHEPRHLCGRGRFRRDQHRHLHRDGSPHGTAVCRLLHARARPVPAARHGHGGFDLHAPEFHQPGELARPHQHRGCPERVDRTSGVHVTRRARVLLPPALAVKSGWQRWAEQWLQPIGDAAGEAYRAPVLKDHDLPERPPQIVVVEHPHVG